MDKKYLVMPELPVIESNLDGWLFESQRLYEEAVKKYIKFKEAEIDAEITYDNAMADQITKLSADGGKVTVMKEIAKSRCAEEYANMMQMNAKKRRYEKWILALESRIQMLKYLMKRKWSDTA
jgi:hypothetical protein